MRLLEDHVVLVTGAAAGRPGRAVAKKVMRTGGSALRTDLYSGQGLDIGQPHDVTRARDWRKAIATLGERFGWLDSLALKADVRISPRSAPGASSLED
jgi:NAD(P)-dependent dehydrogenase (short-subunit alcohol dehydrogenase family)